MNYKAEEHESNGDTYCNWCTGNDLQRLGKQVRIVENRRINRNHPNYCIIKIGQDTEKSPGDLRRLVTLTLVKDNQLILV